MKKILFSLLMLLSITAAWAGEGDGSEEHPFTGEWEAKALGSKLGIGKYLAYDCIINNGKITVSDDKLNNAVVVSEWQSWAVGSPISKYKIDDSGEVSFKGLYDNYCLFNLAKDRLKHTFIITKFEPVADGQFYITGHYSGCYDRGEGTQEKPYSGLWQASELGPKLKEGVYLGFDCTIENGWTTINDCILNKEVEHNHYEWSPKVLIGNPISTGDYGQYGRDNSPEERKGQSFLITKVDYAGPSPILPGDYSITITGYFTGFYSTPDTEGFVHVASPVQMMAVLRGTDSYLAANESAKIILTQDIYMSDLGEGDAGLKTLCSTFKGTLEGNGHTIWAARPEVAHDGGGRYHRQYLFTYSDGAKFKNLTFKNFRVKSVDNHNQAIITSQAKNGCVFENITFDNVSTYVGDGHDNTGAAAGYATTNCTFTNITVKNSDLTADGTQSGAVVGHAMNCTFTNIKVEHCESTGRKNKAGGVTGRADNCKFNDVEILGSFIKTDEGSRSEAGGVAGYAYQSQFTNCTVDDQSCIFVDGYSSGDSYTKAGGIVGEASNCKVSNCINSALIAAGGRENGGIVGFGESTNIDECLNTGMVICIAFRNLADIYNKYKTKTDMICVTKTFKGKEYAIRIYENVFRYRYSNYYGGIVGYTDGGNVSKCVNYGSLHVEKEKEKNTPISLGGIAGYAQGGTISDCLSDFTGAEKAYGICAKMYLYDKEKETGYRLIIQNCLNMTAYEDYTYSKDEEKYFFGSNNYSLANGFNALGVTITTASEVASGEILNLLGDNWEQNIGTDAYPIPCGKGHSSDDDYSYEADGINYIASANDLKLVLKDKANAHISLMKDIYMSDLGEGEAGRKVLCDTFSGTLEGNGHTIWAARPEIQHFDGDGNHYQRQYLFTYSNGAKIKNLTFKNFRIDSRNSANQAVITSQAKNGCLFENITFDNVSIYTSEDNAGAVTGYATTNCAFRNINVINSDITANKQQSGAVVGHAMDCEFQDIKVEHSESTARKEKAGGVVGRADACAFLRVEILGSLITSDNTKAGGVVGHVENSTVFKCVVDDQSCVCAKGEGILAPTTLVGGIVGYGLKCDINYCINSALVAAESSKAGGIAGALSDVVVDGCLNTGMVIALKIDEVKDSFYNKYKTKTDMNCVTKTYKGEEYVIRRYDVDALDYDLLGGIVGYADKITVKRCVNFGSVLAGEIVGKADMYIGGIAGKIKGGTISDCLSDFYGDKYYLGRYNHGICLFESVSIIRGVQDREEINEVSINNCLNLTDYNDFAADRNKWEGFSGGNNYSLAVANEHVAMTTREDVNSGKICNLLGDKWEQNLGTDAYPTPIGSRGVYHTREVSNEYGTVCFPFPVKSDDNIRYYTFSKAINNIAGEVQLLFEYTEDKIPAGTPLLYRISNIAKTCFNNAGDKSKEWADNPIKPQDENASWVFLGTFGGMEFKDTAANDKYYVSNGSIMHAKHTTVPAYRAYFRGPSFQDLQGNGGNEARVRFVVEDEDGEMTAVQMINDDDALRYENVNAGKTYSLMGTEVNDSYRGIVIKNGKKILRK